MLKPAKRAPYLVEEAVKSTIESGEPFASTAGQTRRIEKAEKWLVIEHDLWSIDHDELA